MHLAQDPAADAFLDSDAFALLVGMLLDQQQPMERAFSGPWRICQRLGWQTWSPRAVVEVGEQRLTQVMREKPAIHRYPANMAARLMALAAAVADEYGGRTEQIWESDDASVIYGRLVALPGFGERKAKIFLALLGKQRGLTAAGWREACAPFGEPGSTLSAADVVDGASLAAVRATKREMKTRNA